MTMEENTPASTSGMTDADVDRIARRTAELVWERFEADRKESQEAARVLRAAGAELQAVTDKYGVEIEAVPGGYQITKKKA